MRRPVRGGGTAGTYTHMVMCARNEFFRNGVPLSHSLLVLGPHRSGTSALTRVVNLLGVDLGEDLLPARFDNRYGYWEHRGIFDLHERLLSRVGSAWHDGRPMPLGWQELDGVRALREELRALIERELLGFPLWGVKDPRLGRLLPLWLDLLDELGVDTRFAILVRNPLEIVHSMESRNAFPRSKCVLLYLADMLATIRHTEGRSRAFVSYRELLSDWRAAIDRAGSELGISWPVPPAEAAPRIDEFLRPSERHHAASLEELRREPGLPPCLADLYEALEAAAQGDLGHLAGSVRTAEEVFRSVTTLFAPEVDALEAEVRRLTARLDELEHQDAHRERARAERRADRAEAELAKVERHLLTILSSPLYRSTRGLRRAWRGLTRHLRRNDA